ncbi:hypothetical protein R0137_08440 [Congregibacter brevis]|uniref:Uncharacterized protein n=1 Tax=Congregibacter brevis TaxID=3081201 RepID=A0ABZ0IHN8_9GAMM|nr:hypothetical protein R0137_08440 [Congregibacter sp. IMCC45268]
MNTNTTNTLLAAVARRDLCRVADSCIVRIPRPGLGGLWVDGGDPRGASSFERCAGHRPYRAVPFTTGIGVWAYSCLGFGWCHGF